MPKYAVGCSLGFQTFVQSRGTFFQVKLNDKPIGKKIWMPSMQPVTHLFPVLQCLASAGFCSCSQAWSHSCARPLSSVLFSPPGRGEELTVYWLLTWWLGVPVVRIYRYKILCLAVSFMSAWYYYQNLQSCNSIIRCFWAFVFISQNWEFPAWDQMLDSSSNS